MRKVLPPLMLGISLFVFFLLFQAQGIYGGDTGDLVTAAFVGGVPHPPGYPLYTFLGYLLSKIPLYTVAWRVALLSSVAHAVTICLVYLLVTRITRHALAGFYAALSMAGNYIVFLYSVTPEVFALFDLFVVQLLLLSYMFGQTRRPVYLLLLATSFGLSLTHHHVVLFMVPALVYVLWKYHLTIGRMREYWVASTVIGAIGLLPYVYLPIASSQNPVIDWNHPATVDGFMKLVTRSYYGTFTSGGLFGQSVFQRVLSVKAYGQMLVSDFSWIGVLLIVFGFGWLWRRNKAYFWFITIAFLSLGPIFLFYASFPLLNKFTIATYERFLLPSYMILFIALGIGYWSMLSATCHITSRLSHQAQRIAHAGVGLVLFMLPVSGIGANIQKFDGLSADQTATNLGRDILASVSPNSILLLGGDSPLFTTQYVRYVLGERDDVIVLHMNRMDADEYRVALSKNFPRLALPKPTKTPVGLEFIEANKQKFEIFSNTKLPLGDAYVWVPHGLVFILTDATKVVPVDEMLAENERLWQTYHHPLSGILDRYDHSMLADVANVYSAARLIVGDILLRSDNIREAKYQYEQAIEMGGDFYLPDAYTYLGLTQLFLKECDDALISFEKAKTIGYLPPSSIAYYEAITYGDCVGDEERAKVLLDDYRKIREAQEVPLQTL